MASAKVPAKHIHCWLRTSSIRTAGVEIIMELRTYCYELSRKPMQVRKQKYGSICRCQVPYLQTVCVKALQPKGKFLPVKWELYPEVSDLAVVKTQTVVMWK